MVQGSGAVWCNNQGASVRSARPNTDLEPSTRESRISRSQKLALALQYMRELDMPVMDFLESYLVDELDSGWAVTRRIHTFEEFLKRPNIQAVLVNRHVALGERINTELRSLVGQRWFGLHKPADSIEDMDLSGAYVFMKENAPIWTGFVTQLLMNERAHWASYESQHVSHNGLAYFITAIILRSRARKRSNYLSRLLGLYMTSSGTKRRVVSVLSGLGVCDSYKVLNRVLGKVVDRAKDS